MQQGRETSEFIVHRAKCNRVSDDIVKLTRDKLLELKRHMRTLDVADYPVITANPDISFACNPWAHHLLSPALQWKIAEAQNRVVISGYSTNEIDEFDKFRRMRKMLASREQRQRRKY